MNSWTAARQLREQVVKLWERGDILASLLSDEPLFPKRLTLKVPTSAEITDRFDEVRAWVSELRAMSYLRVEMGEFRHRLFGTNSIPRSVWVDSREEACGCIGKVRLLARFTRLVEDTRLREPRLLPWLAKRPLRAVELADEWHKLLSLVAWIAQHPQSGCYLRQVDLPGIHSKFIEANRGVLSELLEMVLPAEAIDHSLVGASRFARRYGFLDKPLLVRFRILDPGYAPLIGGCARDITLDAESFAALDPAVTRVFMTENEINFLAFPAIAGGMVIFGAGYGFDALRHATWLNSRQLYYWGDIDSHGFAILDQLRSHFPHVESFLMDRATLMAFELQWGEEEKQTIRELPRLTCEEQVLYDELRDNRLRKRVRLEQERIGFGWVESALSVLGSQ